MIKHWIFLILFVVTLLVLPKGGAEALRKVALNGISHKEAIAYSPNSLELENQFLRSEIQRLQNVAAMSNELQMQVRRLLGLEERANDAFFERRERYLTQILSRRLVAVPAQVIFREPISWSSSLWVGVGERDNQALGKRVIEKNSPVVLGKIVVGVVEEVEETRSRVRLITDDRLALSVRAARGGEQSHALAIKIDELAYLLSLQEELAGASEMENLLQTYLGTLDVEASDFYLAKGEIRGSNRSLWHGRRENLKGMGFHYHCSDQEGEAKDLRGNNLLQVGDLLVTTGMDGIFPPDLHVGLVTKVDPLREGATSYTMEAKSLVSDLSNLEEVLILPRNF
ncbi:MAG: rod shape-determining protein MreC [Simkaniaceae bacterium]|nr:rod shape-determining protein MreC [Candidatus Sacchlamyda saccharinae]